MASFLKFAKPKASDHSEHATEDDRSQASPQKEMRLVNDGQSGADGMQAEPERAQRGVRGSEGPKEGF